MSDSNRDSNRVCSHYVKVALLANELKDQSTSKTVLQNLRYYNEFLIKRVTSDEQIS